MKGLVLSYPSPAAAYPQSSSQPGYPHAGPVFQISLLKHTGALILWHQQSLRFTGTLEQCEQAYRDAQTHCLLAGWWSVVSALVLNWIALFSNMSAIRKVRDLAHNPQALSRQPPAGWYPDPSGQPAQRYWDGTTWTHWTNPPAHR